jgi:hypothetical protein
MILTNLHVSLEGAMGLMEILSKNGKIQIIDVVVDKTKKRLRPLFL